MSDAVDMIIERITACDIYEQGAAPMHMKESPNLKRLVIEMLESIPSETLASLEERDCECHYVKKSTGVCPKCNDAGKLPATHVVVPVEPKLLSCPFCFEDDFDEIGLKRHLNKWCEPYPEIDLTPNPPEKDKDDG